MMVNTGRLARFASSVLASFALVDCDEGSRDKRAEQKIALDQVSLVVRNAIAHENKGEVMLDAFMQNINWANVAWFHEAETRI